MLKFIVLAILFLPFIEITGIVIAIREFGFMNAFFFWLAATILGAGIVRTSGLRLTVGVARALQEGKPPAVAALDSALLGVAGILLLIPGYFTDSVAFVLLIPPLRKLAAGRLAKSVIARTGFAGAGPRPNTSAGHSARRSTGPWSHTSGEASTGVSGEAVDASRAVIDVDAVIVDDRTSRET